MDNQFLKISRGIITIHNLVRVTPYMWCISSNRFDKHSRTISAEKLEIKRQNNYLFKGTVSRDCLPLVFSCFMIQEFETDFENILSCLSWGPAGFDS